MASVTGRDGKRRGFGKSFYISKRAEDLLERVAEATRRSQSEVVSMLVETYAPELLADKGQPK